MEQNQTPFAPEAATDEPASPLNPEALSEPASARAEGEEDDGPHFASETEEEAFWKGVTHGIRCGAKPEPTHLPANFEPDGLARSGAGPGLVSAKLIEAYSPVTHDVRGRAIRHDGFTPDKQVAFLAGLASCGVVADACRLAGIHRDTAYDLRNSAAGRAFALAWDAAILIARGRMSDELMSRGMNGCIDRLYRNGELVAERHRHDNRLAMAILTRLDRQAEGMGEGAAVARTIAQDWESFLGVVEAGGDNADAFLAARAKEEEKPEAAERIESTASMLARFKILSLHQAGRAHEIRTADLDPAGMDKWTDAQWLRADLSGFLDALPEDQWPEYARDGVEAAMHGNRRSRRVYLARHPDGGSGEESGFEIWEDEDEGRWMTNYPPPEGFDGFEVGEWGDDDYKRALSPKEQEAVDRDLALDRAEEEAESARELAAAGAARDRAFGFASGQGSDEVVEPPVLSTIVRSSIREGEAG